mmetsp:Transcript_26536/g.25651  ORF Transcript_26536/g.25651 Transcript_26536/m.25651 type:complete len:97 (+) Transcript_26536:207-497(+)
MSFVNDRFKVFKTFFLGKEDLIDEVKLKQELLPLDELQLVLFLLNCIVERLQQGKVDLLLQLAVSLRATKHFRLPLLVVFRLENHLHVQEGSLDEG